MCADGSETTGRTDLTHNADWTSEKGCECNITSDNDVQIQLTVDFHLQSQR